MTPLNPDTFILWLTGFVDALAGQTPTPAQWAIINGKLDSVFNKVTPDRAALVTSTVVNASTMRNIFAGENQFITTGAPAGQLRGYGDADRVERFAISTTC